MTLNFFIAGSTGGPYDMSKDLANMGFYDTRTSIIECSKWGTASYYSHDYSRNAYVYFDLNHYNRMELQNIPFALNNAIELFRSEHNYDDINLYGGSNGGNAIARFLAYFAPDYVNDVVTACTPYNAYAYTKKPTGFLKEVISLSDNIQVNGNVTLVAANSGKKEPGFPSNIVTDGVVPLNSALCGELIYNVPVQVVYGYGHSGLYETSVIQNALAGWH
jgi:hypothetical protein